MAKGKFTICNFYFGFHEIILALDSNNFGIFWISESTKTLSWKSSRAFIVSRDVISPRIFRSHVFRRTKFIPNENFWKFCLKLSIFVRKIMEYSQNFKNFAQWDGMKLRFGMRKFFFHYEIKVDVFYTKSTEPKFVKISTVPRPGILNIKCLYISTHKSCENIGVWNNSKITLA